MALEIYKLDNIYKENREVKCCYNCIHWEGNCNKGVNPTIPGNTSCRHWLYSKDKRKYKTSNK